MPVLLDRPDLEAWLSGAAGPGLLRPAAENRLRMWPVSRRVNRTGDGDDPAPLAQPNVDKPPRNITRSLNLLGEKKRLEPRQQSDFAPQGSVTGMENVPPVPQRYNAIACHTIFRVGSSRVENFPIVYLSSSKSGEIIAVAYII
jgi:hypothetical protein